MSVARHKTALTRNQLSRPLSLALADGLFDGPRTLLDYGCGRGDDLRQLAALGVTCGGWDPVHRPHGARSKAEIVNLGFVLNVIEDPVERVDTLCRAWALAVDVLIVAVRMTWDARDLSGRPFRDGILTSSGTFQKFYDQSEIADWLAAVLGTTPMVAAPGIFYIFRNAQLAQQALAHRVSSRCLAVAANADLLLESHKETLAPLMDFVADHGRVPRTGDMDESAERAIVKAMGTLSRAFSLIQRVTDIADWDRVVGLRRRDLLVYLAMSRFGLRPRYSQLPPVLARDIRAHFGTYERACAEADRLLLALGDPNVVLLAARASLTGKRTPTALYVHRTALEELSPVLRAYEGCAQVVAGQIPEANVIKLTTGEAKVSYLAYPDFDRVGHPELRSSWLVDLTDQRVHYRDYAMSKNPPVLHRKEEFVSDSYPRRALFKTLTDSEERAGLFEDTSTIGSRDGWQQTLREKGRALRGHRLIRIRTQNSHPDECSGIGTRQSRAHPQNS